MLDQQLAEDSNIKKKTKVLRPTSGVKRSPGYRRVRSASYVILFTDMCSFLHRFNFALYECSDICRL